MSVEMSARTRYLRSSSFPKWGFGNENYSQRNYFFGLLFPNNYF